MANSYTRTKLRRARQERRRNILNTLLGKRLKDVDQKEAKGYVLFGAVFPVLKAELDKLGVTV